MPSRCSQPPCRNIANSTDSAGDLSYGGGDCVTQPASPDAVRAASPVATAVAGSLPITSLGTAAYSSRKATCRHTDAGLPRPSSGASAIGLSTNATTLTSRSRRVTQGVRRVGLTSWTGSTTAGAYTACRTSLPTTSPVSSRAKAWRASASG